MSCNLSRTFHTDTPHDKNVSDRDYEDEKTEEQQSGRRRCLSGCYIDTCVYNFPSKDRILDHLNRHELTRSQFYTRNNLNKEIARELEYCETVEQCLSIRIRIIIGTLNHNFGLDNDGMTALTLSYTIAMKHLAECMSVRNMAYDPVIGL